MKPIIFVRITDMKYYRGITDNDKPCNGGAYVADTGEAHECYNFDGVEMEDGNNICFGYAQLIGSASKSGQIQLHIEKIAGCKLYKDKDYIDDVIVVWCSKSNENKNMRVVGFYKGATIYRFTQYLEFENGYIQDYNFVADKDNCILLPYSERHSNNAWYVPISHRNNWKFGFGRSSIWYACNDNKNEEEIAYVERMINSIENYNGENWVYKNI